MKKKLLSALVLLCLVVTAAYAATTTHYSYILPTVGASQNVWGTMLNTIFNSIDSNIWSASQGMTTGVNSQSSAANITLTNPLNNFQSIALTTTSKKLILPAMNATQSMVVGGRLIIYNAGANDFSITAQDGTTVIVSSLTAGQFIRLNLTSGATANGTFTIEGPYLTAVGTLSLGTSTSVTNPAINGDLTSGFYTPAVNTVAVSAGGVEVMQWNAGGGSVNYVAVSPASTGLNPIISTAGSDTNIGLTLTPKGSGAINLNGAVTAASTVGITGTLGVTGASTLTGGGTSVTPSAGDNSTKIATTAYVDRGAGSGMVFISATTASNVGSLNITVPSGYVKYRLEFNNLVPASNNQPLEIQTSSSNCSPVDSSQYEWNGIINNTNPTSSTVGGTNSGAILVTGSVGQDNTAGLGATGFIEFNDLSSASTYKMWTGQTQFYTNAPIDAIYNFGGRYNGDLLTKNCLFISYPSGNIAGGSLYLYGLRGS